MEPEVFALEELTELCRRSVKVAKETAKFLDGVGVVATFEINDSLAGGSGADHLALTEKPTEGLLSHLAAMRALYAEDDLLGAAKSHVESPQVYNWPPIEPDKDEPTEVISFLARLQGPGQKMMVEFLSDPEVVSFLAEELELWDRRHTSSRVLLGDLLAFLRQEFPAS